MISMWRNDIKYKYMFLFPLKKLACNWFKDCTIWSHMGSSSLVMIDSGNGLSPVSHQAIAWTNMDIQFRDPPLLPPSYHLAVLYVSHVLFGNVWACVHHVSSLLQWLPLRCMGEHLLTFPNISKSVIRGVGITVLLIFSPRPMVIS